jgi:hypothetical protein
LNEWQWIFIIGACIYIIPAFIFFAFGSGDAQKFNEVQSKADEEKTNVKTP